MLELLAFVADDEIDSPKSRPFDARRRVDLWDENVLLDLFDIAVPGKYRRRVLRQQLPQQRHINHDLEAIARRKRHSRQDRHTRLPGKTVINRQSFADRRREFVFASLLTGGL